LSIRIETERLRLREYERGDFNALAALLSDPITMAHWPAPLDETAARAWHERALDHYGVPPYGRLAIELKTGEYIGDAGIVRSVVDGRDENDLGYIVHRRYWGRRYGLETARALLDYGHRLGLVRVVANMASDNTPSVKVAEHLGLRLERVFRNPRNRNLETRLYVSVGQPT